MYKMAGLINYLAGKYKDYNNWLGETVDDTDRTMFHEEITGKDLSREKLNDEDIAKIVAYAKGHEDSNWLLKGLKTPRVYQEKTAVRKGYVRYVL